ncbi:MAG TPA: aspartate-semialdehyde dehydrogenase [Anaeromyxobacteraceae bacterium]|nr:aspartate-semialdehyde dehydrogenase [Anaeromyxobacteraceae bacterium]
MSERPLAVAVLGATGAVGRALLAALEESDLELAPPGLYASARSEGEEIEFRGEPLKVRVAGAPALEGLDLAFLATSAELSRSLAGGPSRGPCTLIDFTPAFRDDPEVPLVLPELTPEALRTPARRGLYALPGPSAALLALALAPLHRAAGVRRAAVVTLESASAGGQKGVEDLEAELRAMLALHEPRPPTALPHRLAFNLVPGPGPFAAGGASSSEEGLTAEVRRLLGSSVALVASSVRVPIFYGLCQSVNLATRRKFSADEARALLSRAPGVKVVDAPSEGVFPMPMLAVNDDAVLVGRVREDPSQENGLELFLAGDNLRRGAATGAVGVARILAERLRSAGRDG